MARNIDGTPYVDVVHIKERGSTRATGMGKKGPYTHMPHDVLQFLEQYFEKHVKGNYARVKGGIRRPDDEGPDKRRAVPWTFSL